MKFNKISVSRSKEGEGGRDGWEGCLRKKNFQRATWPKSARPDSNGGGGSTILDETRMNILSTS